MKGLTGYSHLDPLFAGDRNLFLTGLGDSGDFIGCPGVFCVMQGRMEASGSTGVQPRIGDNSN